VDSKTKLAPGAVNNNKDLEVDAKKEEPSFFGSFFSSNKNSAAAKKKGVAVMEAVCSRLFYIKKLETHHFSD
jgi:vacuolar protein sorting-associated protein 1